MDLTVFGANGPTGRLVVRQALANGHHVRAVTRKPDEFPHRSPLLDVVLADVTDPKGVEQALTGSQAVISTYGVPYSKKKVNVYSHGITNIISAMRGHGISRLVCVSSTTVATEPAPDESLIWRTAMRPLLRGKLGKTLYDDMQLMEEAVQNSDLNWTIVRPGGLFNSSEPTSDYEVSPQRLPGQVTSRADLAQTLIAEATDPQHPRTVIEVLTRSGTPSFTTFIKEALGKG